MGITPYEQRFNYYMAARDQLTQQYHADYEKVQITANDNKNILSHFLPKYPTAAEIFALAEEIKAFAEKK
jgi:hypothetical protein